MSPAPGTVLRTVRHLRPRQVLHQLLDSVRGPLRPAPPPAPPPVWALERPTAPFPGAPSHARLQGPARVELLNRSHDFGERIDWELAEEGPLFAFHLHQHDFLRAPELAPALRARVLDDWIQRHRGGTGWHPANISLRALTWLKLLSSPAALPDAARAGALASLAAQLDTLARGLEIRLLANHYLSNLLALVAGGVALAGPCADAWRAHVPALREQLDEQVLRDGAHFERSPMYHALMLENVLDLLNWVRAGDRAPHGLEAQLTDVAARMLGALAVYRHPDGEIALFADSALGIAHAPGVLEAYAAALGVEARGPERPGVLDAAGYVRLAAGPWSALVSVAGPAPAYQPGHAHADALSFELCFEGTRLVTDSGVGEYVPGPRRDSARATRSHATIEVDGRDQAELWAAHRIGGRPRVSCAAASPTRVEASCAGWATPDTVQRRVLEMRAEALEITDTLEGRPRPLRLVLPLAPGLEPELRGSCARVASCRIQLPESARWRVEQAEAYPEFGRCEQRAVLVGEAEGAGPFVWSFRVL